MLMLEVIGTESLVPRWKPSLRRSVRHSTSLDQDALVACWPNTKQLEQQLNVWYVHV